jgi:ABC-2 type transport system ATP-binding protein
MPRWHWDETAMTNVIEVRGLHKSYRKAGKTLPVLRGIECAIARGEIVGLLGENGSGKTTLVKTAAGIVPRDAGEVSIIGVDPDVRPREVARHTGAVFPGGRNVYWRLTARENLQYFARLRGVALDDAALTRAIDALDLGAEQNVELRRLSTGLKQRVAVACSFVHRPRLVFLDEPTIGLDAATTTTLTRRLGELARDEGTAMLVTSHDSAFLEQVCDRVLVLGAGTLQFAGTTAALRQHLRDRRTYQLAIGAVTARLSEALCARGAQRHDDPASGAIEFVFHRPDGSFLAEVVPEIARHGGNLLDVTTRQRALGELMQQFRVATAPVVTN